MMYAVFCKNTTILVDYEKESNIFIIEDVATHEQVQIPHRELQGDGFKYPCDFKDKFLKPFIGKTEWIFTSEGYEAFISLQNANRDGIFTF